MSVTIISQISNTVSNTITNLANTTTKLANTTTNTTPLSGKIQRLTNMLLPHVSRSNLQHKHAAMIISGGKVINIGFNHDRMTCQKRYIMNYHAEIHALNQYININNISSLKTYINDTQKCISFKKKYPRGSQKEEK